MARKDEPLTEIEDCESVRLVGQSDGLPSMDEVRARLRCAITQLKEQDAFLLEADVNERSLTHRLAIYIEAYFPGWDVDCEYNRMGDGDPKRIPDWRDLTEEPEPAGLTRDTEGRTVFPDIIVHHRGPRENLLVVEVKKSGSRQLVELDQKKLRVLRDETGLGYTYGVTVVLPVGGDFRPDAEVEVEFVE